MSYWPGRFRPYQEKALAELAERWAAGDRRAWIVMPPGAGKTLVGLEAARRLGQKVVVFVPNSAIQGQWIAHWNAFTRPVAATAGTKRDLGDDITVLTYQSLAVFQPDDETDEEGRDRSGSLKGRLHANGTALIDALHAAGPLTIILDECHHLLQVWGRLLAEVLAELEDAHVVGLTGTPSESLSETESGLVDTLFRSPIHGTSIPAMVRDGYLAPFAELAWVAVPTAVERDYIAGEAERFTELCTDLLEPGFASTDFLTWLRQRFVWRKVDTQGRARPEGHQLEWAHLATAEPEHTDAALRLHYAGLLDLPPGARLLERHRTLPHAHDWMLLLGDYVRNCLRAKPDADERDAEAIERIRAALPSIGYQLTKRGVRAGRSPLDRVLARSAAKSYGAVEIASVESAALGDRLRMLVLCDHERATARLSARLRGVLSPEAGSAWLLLDLLSADERTRELAPILVTGRGVAAAPGVAAGLIAWVDRVRPDLGLRAEPEGDGSLVRVEGAWTSRVWVGLVTEYFESGGCRILVGTRALLGEGWDARGVNTVVDLTTATTATAVVQSRGRALRLDPEWPEKVAHTWTVTCVSHDHPKGNADWDRFVRKHAGYLGVNADGDVLSGVAHIDPSFSPYDPPPDDRIDAVNARMIARAEERAATRERWRIGAPYADLMLPTLRVRFPARRPGSGAAAPVAAEEPGRRPPLSPGGAERHDGGPAVEPEVVPAARGVRLGGSALPERPGFATPAVVVAGVVAWLVAVLTFAVAVPLGGAVSLALLVTGPAAAFARYWWVEEARRREFARRLPRAAGTPDVLRLGRAVADALHHAGHSPVGASGVRPHVDSDGGYRITLVGGGPEAAEAFTTALDEVLSPLVGPVRYLIPRHRLELPESPRDLRRFAGAVLRGRSLPENPAVYHKVPAVFGRSRKGAEEFARAWHVWVSAGEPVYTGSERGQELLYLHYGSDPYPVETSTRLMWS